jgi:hypothetical protein
MTIQVHPGQLYTLTHSASVLRLHPNTVKYHIDAGRLPAVRLSDGSRAVRGRHLLEFREARAAV